MKRIIALICAVLALCFILCACGDDTGVIGSADGPTTIVVGQELDGFTHNKAAAAGFGMGADTLADITSRLGDPDDTIVNERHASTSIEAYYPYGRFIFRGEKDATPVLVQCTISEAGLAGPFGVKLGMSLEQVADLVFPDGSDIIKDAGYTDVYLYQRGSGDYGKFMLLTAEYQTTASTDISKIICSAPSYDDGVYTILELYFNSARELTSYVLSQA